jgi:hypothetical protein
MAISRRLVLRKGILASFTHSRQRDNKSTERPDDLGECRYQKTIYENGKNFKARVPFMKNGIKVTAGIKHGYGPVMFVPVVMTGFTVTRSFQRPPDNDCDNCQKQSCC